MSEPTGKNRYWELLGWCLAWIGFGGCVYLSNYQGPIVNIQLGPKEWSKPVQVEKVEP